MAGAGEPDLAPGPGPGDAKGNGGRILLQAIKGIRLEPICVLHMTSAVMVSMIVNNLMMERACTINIAASKQDCQSVLTRNYTEDDELYEWYQELGTEIQQKVASNNVWRSAVEYSLPIAFMLVMGNWSDKHGRKPILLLPVIGYMITNAGLLLSLYYEEWSLEVIALWTSLPQALTGSSSLFGMAAYSWVGDTSTIQLRTVRIGMLSCGWFLGTALGMTLGGHLYHTLQFKGIFILAESLEIAAFLSILFFIGNTRLSPFANTDTKGKIVERTSQCSFDSNSAFCIKSETSSPEPGQGDYDNENENENDEHMDNDNVSIKRSKPTLSISRPRPRTRPGPGPELSRDHHDFESKEMVSMPTRMEKGASEAAGKEERLLPSWSSHIINPGTKGKANANAKAKANGLGEAFGIEGEMKEKRSDEKESMAVPVQKMQEGRTWNRFSDLFDYTNVTEAFRTAFKRREGNKRVKILILFIVLLLGLAPTAGETSVLYLFVVQQLDWRSKEYGNFGTYMLFIATLGTLLSMGVLSYLLKLPDPLIGIVSCCSQMAAAFVYGFATKSWMMYLAPLIDSINGTVTIVTRSMGSKLVSPDELGRLNAFFGIGDSLVPLVATTLYNALYAMTLTSFPGAFFLVSAAITVPVLLIFAWFYWQVRKEQNEELKTDGTAEEGGDSTDSEASGSHTPEKERF